VTPRATVLQGRAEALPLPDASVDAFVFDPPYNLDFMGRSWDRVGTPRVFQSQAEAWGREILRVLKPGGYAVAFGADTTGHRLASGLEDAGLQPIHTVAWIYAQGMPKGLNAARALDRRRDDRAEARQVTAAIAAARDAAGLTNADINTAMGFSDMATRWTTQGVSPEVPGPAEWAKLRTLLKIDDPALEELVADLNARKGRPGEHWNAREQVGTAHRVHQGSDVAGAPRSPGNYAITAPASDLARQWDGWHTKLKPAYEPVYIFRRPMIGGLADNLRTHGVGALNIDGCRVPAGPAYAAKCASVAGLGSNRTGGVYGAWTGVRTDSTHSGGRFPANVVLSHAATPDGEDLCADGCIDGCPVLELDRQSGQSTSPPVGSVIVKRERAGQTAKGDERARIDTYGHGDSGGISRIFHGFRFHAKATSAERVRVGGVVHNTVKPLELMRHFVRMVTPPGGLVVDQFGGSGTTAEAAVLEGFDVVTLDLDAEHLPLIRERINRAINPAAYRPDPKPGQDAQPHLFEDLV
jgi:hypothetical protein